MTSIFLVSLVDKQGKRLPVELEVHDTEVIFARDSQVRPALRCTCSLTGKP